MIRVDRGFYEWKTFAIGSCRFPVVIPTLRYDRSGSVSLILSASMLLAVAIDLWRSRETRRLEVRNDTMPDCPDCDAELMAEYMWIPQPNAGHAGDMEPRRTNYCPFCGAEVIWPDEQ